PEPFTLSRMPILSHLMCLIWHVLKTIALLCLVLNIWSFLFLQVSLSLLLCDATPSPLSSLLPSHKTIRETPKSHGHHQSISLGDSRPLRRPLQLLEHAPTINGGLSPCTDHTLGLCSILPRAASALQSPLRCPLPQWPEIARQTPRARSSRAKPLRSPPFPYLESDARTYHDALQDKDADSWTVAMKADMGSTDSNLVRDLVEQLDGVRPIGCK
ncbi:Unknown protein, partial [Striga hermonthica]